MLRTLLRIWVIPFMLVLVLFLVLMGIGEGCDLWLLRHDMLDNQLFHRLLPTQEDFVNLVGNTVEFLASIVGIAITVASIMVQLSANRFSSRVIDLFIEDRVNLWMFCFQIVTPLHGLALAYLGQSINYPTTHLVIFELLTLFDLLLLIPYFNYLFDFLRPENIVHRIEGSVRLSQLAKTRAPSRLETLRNNLVGSVTQLSDVVLNSISSSDMHLALMSIESLKSLTAAYLEVKPSAPEDWFHVPHRTFLGLEESKLERLAADRTWVELHCLKQYELIFVQSLNRVREVSGAIAHRTQELGHMALVHSDARAFELTVLFFNTYLRHALNAIDVRTMFHTFYQYRRLAEGCLNPEWRDQLKKIALYFKYYGQECERRGITFVMEIAAYDLRVLVEMAYNTYPPAVGGLMEVFLEVDHVPDTESEKSQRGVRKSQAILAAFFLAHDERGLARQIFEDMRLEDLDRMASIERELLVMVTEEFWEIQNRGSNFYYVPPQHQKYLREFFSWFGTSRETAEAT